MGAVYILYTRVHLNGDRNRESRATRAIYERRGSYGDSKQQPGPNGACKFASCRDSGSEYNDGPLE